MEYIYSGYVYVTQKSCPFGLGRQWQIERSGRGGGGGGGGGQNPTSVLI